MRDPNEMTQKEHMLRGEIYYAGDPELVADRLRTRRLLQAFNALLPSEKVKRRALYEELFPNPGQGLWIEAPFYCDYGYNIHFDERVYLNFNCIFLDVTTIRIGARTLFGPAVQIYTATHPADYRERAKEMESAKPITIGADCWIGGAAVILPGVSIGDRTIIGAGSVVAKDIPAGSLAVGNPCRVVRSL